MSRVAAAGLILALAGALVVVRIASRPRSTDAAGETLVQPRVGNADELQAELPDEAGGGDATPVVHAPRRDRLAEPVSEGCLGVRIVDQVQRPLQGLYVRLYDASSNVLRVTGTTDKKGELRLSDLTRKRYDLRVFDRQVHGHLIERFRDVTTGTHHLLAIEEDKRPSARIEVRLVLPNPAETPREVGLELDQIECSRISEIPGVGKSYWPLGKKRSIDAGPLPAGRYRVWLSAGKTRLFLGERRVHPKQNLLLGPYRL